MKLNDSDVMNGVKEMRQRNLQITFTKPLFVLRYIRTKMKREMMERGTGVKKLRYKLFALIII